jgi:hypothetical protein
VRLGVVFRLTHRSRAASGVEVTSNTDGFGLGEYVGNPAVNFWVVSSGVITSFDFASGGALNGLFMASIGSMVFAGMSDTAGPISAASETGLVFERLDPTSDVPIPATLALFGLGLLGLGWSRRKLV